MRKRILYSQNFLKDRGLISKLINKSLLDKEDIVYEIGAGEGIITEQLLKYCKKVVAFEIDKNLYNKLKNKYSIFSNLELCFGNFLEYSLPDFDYKLFSNIPFRITAEEIEENI